MVNYALSIQIPYSGDPDPTLPWADPDDGLLVPGSIVLVEPAHSANPIVGVPAAGQNIPNIAWKRFSDLYGAAVFTGKVDNGSGAAGNILTVSAVAAGTVLPGMQITGTGITVGAIVGAQISGTPGGVGTYNYVGNALLAAATTITATTPTQANSALTLLASGTQTNVFSMERTSLGGLHMMASKVNNNVFSQALSIWADYAASPVGSYLAVNHRHSFYISRWEKVTRASEVAPCPPKMVLNATSTSNFDMVMLGGSGANYEYPWTVHSNYLGVYDSADPNTVGNTLMRAIGNTTNAGTLSDTSMANKGFYAGVLGCAPGAWANNTSYGNKSGSSVLYRAYVEDLTVSGRTFAQVLAADQAMYAQAFGVGGRYYGDTVPSVPATVLP